MKLKLDAQMILGLAALGLAGIAPNLFPAAQAGIVKLSVTGKFVLLPSVLALMVIFLAAKARGYPALAQRMAVGAAAGLVATFGLEVVRIISFRLGGMPGDMPRLLGVLLTDRFMVGPSPLSDILGWGYHFWNGVAFGLIFVLILGRRSIWWTIIYGQLIGIGFLASPAVKSLGIGAFGLDMPAMPLTVVIAHLAFGILLGLGLRRGFPEPDKG
jgi:hypothetical protein